MTTRGERRDLREKVIQRRIKEFEDKTQKSIPCTPGEMATRNWLGCPGGKYCTICHPKKDKPARGQAAVVPEIDNWYEDDDIDPSELIEPAAGSAGPAGSLGL